MKLSRLYPAAKPVKSVACRELIISNSPTASVFVSGVRSTSKRSVIQTSYSAGFFIEIVSDQRIPAIVQAFEAVVTEIEGDCVKNCTFSGI